MKMRFWNRPSSDFEIRQGGGLEYQLVFDGDTDNCLRVRLAPLKGDLFADVTAGCGGERLFSLPIHLLFRIHLEGDDLHYELFGSSWLEEGIIADKSLSFADLGDGAMLLTIPPEELKSLILRYASNPEAFETDEVIHRQAPNPAVDLALLCGEGSVAGPNDTTSRIWLQDCGSEWTQRVSRPAASQSWSTGLSGEVMIEYAFADGEKKLSLESGSTDCLIDDRQNRMTAMRFRVSGSKPETLNLSFRSEPSSRQHNACSLQESK
jgi:hypothetical protein